MKKKVALVRTGDLSKATAKQLPLGLPPRYWAFLRDYKQTKVARSLKRPILVLQGARDYQVTKADFALWEKELAGRKNVSFRLYPHLNHLFMTGKGRSIPSEYRKAGHLAKKVVEDMADWLKKH